MEQLDAVLIWILYEILFFNILVLPLLFYYLWGKYSTTLSLLKKKNFCVYLILITAFCVLDKSSGDYFHYLDIIKDLSDSPTLTTHLEPFYVWLISVTHGNYLLFRIIVWGFSTFSIMLLIKHFFLDYNFTYIFFILYVLLFFSYTRAFLSISIFFLGYSFLIKPYRELKPLSMFCGLALMLIASLFLHKGTIILLVLFPFSFLKISKKFFFLLIFLFPFFVYYIDAFIATLFTNIELVGGNYLLSDKTEVIGSLGTMIFLVFYFVSVLLLLSRIFSLVTLKKSRIAVPVYVERMYTFTIIILYVAFVLSFLSYGHAAVSYRLRNMAFIPLFLIISYFENCKEFGKKRVALALFLIIIVDNCYLGYMYYLKSVLGL